MATYVNNLRLKEIATGDESGTWGTSTNTNLELIGEALGFGTEAITTNADTHTTTVADGSSDAGRAMYLKYTGTLDSACTITIGPNTMKRMQFIENGTSGSQNIIISQGSGANITIPPGDVKAVYLDGAGSGAAVVDAFASLNVVDLKVEDDLTVTDDATIGGILDITDTTDASDATGDTGALRTEGGASIAKKLFVGTDLDVDGTTNLDVVDIDGAVDMASTLQVDGAITSSSDLTLTSAGPAISLVDSDNNPDYQIKNGNGSLRFIDTTNSVDLATFTAGEVAINEGSADVDFRVESNGNANMLFVDGGNDRVGIGTSSPRGVLDLGSGSGDGTLDNTPANYQLILEAAQSTTGDIGRNIAFVNSTQDVSAAINSVDGGANLTQDLMFAVANSGTLSEVMRLDATGNVGIGTTSPNSLLDIKDVHSQLRLTDSDDDKFILFSYSGGKLVTRNNDTSTTVNQFTLTEDGDFGIGTINPDHQLHVVSAGNAELEVERTSGAAVLTQAQSALGVTGTSSNHDFGFLTNGSVRMRIDNTGRVGINRTPAIAN